MTKTSIIFLCITVVSFGIVIAILYHIFKSTTKRLNARIQRLEELRNPKALYQINMGKKIKNMPPKEFKRIADKGYKEAMKMNM